jgi:hypothetical protein
LSIDVCCRFSGINPLLLLFGRRGYVVHRVLLLLLVLL